MIPSPGFLSGCGTGTSRGVPCSQAKNTARTILSASSATRPATVFQIAQMFVLSEAHLRHGGRYHAALDHQHRRRKRQVALALTSNNALMSLMLEQIIAIRIVISIFIMAPGGPREAMWGCMGV